MKVRLNVSGRFRSEQRAQDFATQDSVLSSVRKPSRNRLQALLAGTDALFFDLPASRSSGSPRPACFGSRPTHALFSKSGAGRQTYPGSHLG